MSKKHSKVFSIFLAGCMALGLFVVGGPTTIPAALAANTGVSLAEFSGRLGEWGNVNHDSFGVKDTLVSLKAYQQDTYLYVSVEAEANGFGDNPVIYIDNGGTTTKFQVTAWSTPIANAYYNNRITHKVEGGKLYEFVSGTTWNEVADSSMVEAKSTQNDFMEYKIPLSSLGVSATRAMRIGFFNGLNFYLPESGKPMLVVDAAFQPLDADNMPTITIDGNPSEWKSQGLTKIATGRADTNYGMFGGDLYGFRDGDWLYILHFGRDKTGTSPRSFDTRGSSADAATCVVMNTDSDPNTGYSPTFTTMYAAAGADYQIADTMLGKATGTGYDWIDLGSLVDASYLSDPKAYVSKPDDAFIRAYGVGPFTDFGSTEYFSQCAEIAINLAELEKRGEEKFADIIKLGIFIDGAAYTPVQNTTYAPVPCAVDYNFTMTGNKADWAKIETGAFGSLGDYRLRMTTDNEKLYTMVSGVGMNTVNYYFISLGDTGGYTRNGRPNVSYIVANGCLYTVTGNNTSTSNYLSNATRGERISMEYFPDNIMMQLKLSQIGNPAPANIKISYYGKNAITLPIAADEFLPLTTSFVREKEAGVFYPEESYDKLNNPFMGWAPSGYGNTRQPKRMGYMEVRWNNIEPNKGEYNFTSTSFTNTLNAAKNANGSINLRVQLDSPSSSLHLDIPQWLYNEMDAYRDKDGNPVSPGRYYNSSGVGQGFAPNYNHPLLIEYHQKLIKAIAEEVAKPESPWSAVGNVMIGSLGHWGEFHNWPEEDSGPFPNLSVSNQYVQHYLDAYADNDNIQAGIRYATPIASQEKMGLFNDLIGLDGDTKAWVSWFTDGRNETYRYDDSGRTLEEYLADARMPDFWKYAYSGGEYGNGGDPTDSTIMNVLNQLRISHTSWIGPHTSSGGGMTSPTDTNATNITNQKNFDAMMDIMGYRYVVERFAVNGDADFHNGGSFTVEMTINNKGVAPFYRKWPLEISLIDGAGNVAYSWTANDVDIRDWLPGRNEVSATLTLPPVANLNPGDYTFAIAILDINSAVPTPGIDLSIMGRRDDGRYAMDLPISVSDNLVITSPVKTIVSGYAANIPADIAFADDAAAFDLGLYNPDGVLIDTIAVSSNGRYTFKVTASSIAAAGVYVVKAVGAEAGCAIDCVEAPADLWVPVAIGNGNDVTITFASDVTFNAARQSVSVDGVTIANSKVSVSGQVVSVSDVTAVEGQTIVIAGVKYADLFPSYSFTFTLKLS